MLLWGHLEKDGITILGLICWHCVGVLRRRWPGWRLSELCEHFRVAADARERHKGWRAADIAFIRTNRWHEAITAHKFDGGVDGTKRSAKSTHKVVETLHLVSEALWPRTCFVKSFDMEPEEAGYTEIAYPMPDGCSVSGVRMPWDGKEALPAGVIPISKDFKIEVKLPTAS